MAKGENKTRELFRNLLDEYGGLVGHEFADRDLRAALYFHLMDGGRWRAFHAMSLVANKLIKESNQAGEDFDGVAPDAMVAVPWWAVRAMYIGYSTWLGGQKGRGKPLSLGKAFEVKRPRSGKKSIQEVSKERDRDMQLAALVAAKQGKLEFAIADVAAEIGLGKRTVWAAWSKYGEAAKNAFLQLQSKRV